MRMFIEKEVRQKAQGLVRCQIIDSRTKRVKRDTGWQKNIILNQGMDMVAARVWADCFTHCVAGTGTTPTSDDSGTTQATQSGTGVTISGGSFVFTNTATDAGKVIKWDTGQVARIVTVTNSTTVVVANSATVGAGEFTVFRTNQTGLTTEAKRSNTYLTGAGNCETVTTSLAASGLVQLRRTYDFTAEVGSVTYAEIGFSYTATVASNLFSRIKLGSTLALVSGDQLRVIYELQITVTPYTPRATTPTITGWASTGGSEMMENLCLSVVASNGTSSTMPVNLIAVNEPFFTTSVSICLSTVSTALQSSPSVATNGVQRTNAGNLRKAVTLGSYASLSFTNTKSCTFSISEGNLAGIRSIFTTYFPASTDSPGLCFLLTNAQTKANTTSLTLSFRYTWDRTLV